MELDLLPTFVAFAEHLNFTRAARVLHLSQPAVHMQVKKLEESLGVALYRREGRALSLTHEGEIVARFGRETASRARELLAEVRGGGAREPVVLAAGEGAFLYLLGPAIRSYRAADRAPLRLLTRDGAGAIEEVRSGRAHLAVAALDTPPPDFAHARLTTVDAVVVMPNKHPLARKRTVRARDLNGAALVVPPEGRPQRATIAQAFRRTRASFEVAVEASGWEVTIHFVALGLGLAIVNGFCRLPRGLVARPIPEVPGVDYHVLHRASAIERADVVALRAALIAEAGAWKREKDAAWSRRSR